MVGVMNPLVPLPNMRYEMYYQSPVYQQLFKDTLEKAVEESRVQQKDKIISINSPKNNGKN